MKMKQKPLLCAVLILLLGLGAAHAQNGYTVLAQAKDGTLSATVIKYTDTGERAMLIGETKDGTLTQAVCGEQAFPTGCLEGAVTVELHCAQTEMDESTVTLRQKPKERESSDFIMFRLLDDSWQLLVMQSRRGDFECFITNANDGYLAYVTDYKQNLFTGITMPFFSTDMQTFSASQAIETAAEVYQQRLANERAFLQARWQAAFADTDLVSADIFAKQYQYRDNEILSVLAVAHTEQATVVAVLTDTGKAAVNRTLFPPDVEAEAVSLSFPDEGADATEAPYFIIRDSRPDTGSLSAYFQQTEQGDWIASSFAFWKDKRHCWNADFTDGIMRLTAGEVIGEEGHLYRRLDAALLRFETFDFQAMQAAMDTLYDDYMAGEPPMIPDDGTAAALPQPCDAALKRGTYPVYTGPGTQYYREANGKAAVSSGDWVQIFGTDGDWVLVQYRIDGPLLRFGYISTSALADPSAVPALTLTSVSLGVTENEFVTSNPLGQGGKIELPRGGASMTQLATFGDFWRYVELTLPGGKPARMFTEVTPSHG